MRALAALALVTLCAAQEQTPEVEWTVMIYLDADNDLEAPMMDDLAEMLQVESTAEVRVIALVDRHPRGAPTGIYSDVDVANLKNWKTAKILRIEKGKLVEHMDRGEINMGDPSTLTHFIDYVHRCYPAKRRALIFADHGSGWAGVCSDESSRDDMLTLKEISASLKESGVRFELIGFDACLMATIEVASALAPFGRVLVASEEEEPGYGWAYAGALQALVKNPRMDGAEFGKVIAESVRDFYEKSKDDEVRHEGYGFTLSVVALDKIGPVAQAVAKVADTLEKKVKSGGRPAWLGIARARARTEEYGDTGDPMGNASIFDLVHLGNLLDLEEVVTAVRACVILSVRGKLKPNANGLAIFLPPTPDALDNDELGRYADTEFARSNAWSRFLAAYAGEAGKDAEAPGFKTTAASASKLGRSDSITLSSKVETEDLDDIWFALAQQDGDDLVIVGELPTSAGKDGVLQQNWDGRWFTLETKDRSVVCPITGLQPIDEKAGSHFAQISAQARLKGETRWRDVTLSFDVTMTKEGARGRFLYAHRSTRFGEVALKLKKGDEIRAVYIKIDAEGNEDSKFSKDILTIDELKDFVVGYRRVASGTYYLGFTAIDFAGNYNEDYAEVDVE